MIDEGTWVWSKTHHARAKIIEVFELWEYTQCRLWFPKDDAVLVHRPDEIEASNQADDQDLSGQTKDHVRFASVLGKVAKLINDDKLLAPLDSAVIPLPHQVKALQRVVGKTRVRLLFADEVGLGKTIEAGLAIKELKMRGRIKRILVVAPKGLIPQWIVELREKFGEEFRHFEPSDFSGYRKISGTDNVWKSYDQVICSMDAVKPLETRRGWTTEQITEYNQERILGLCSAGWDLLIIDESHRVAGSADTVARHAMARMLADTTPHVLLLSATPHQGKAESFHRLMTLLDRDAFPDESSVSRDRVAPYVVRTEKRNAVDNKGNALFKPRLTKLIPIAWDAQSDQQELYEAVTEYVREGYNQAMREKNNSMGFLMILMQRLVTSSTRAIAATLERRLEILGKPAGQMELFSNTELDELSDLDGQAQLDNVLKKTLKALKDERKEVELLLDAAKHVMARGPDAKAKALLDWIMKLQQEEGDPDLKVLIFTEFVPTQEMLADYLTEGGFSVVTLNGSLGMDERKEVQRRFSEDARIMISTDAGGEGLNLQFCHIIINFDLGWRPMALEQRIGRVDRIGQKHVVKALNFVLEDSVEYRIREVLERKLSVIFEQFGIDKTSDVLDSEEGAHMFDKLFIEALLNPDKLEHEIESVTKTVESEARWNKDQLSVLQGSNDGSGPSSDISTQPLADYLEVLVKSHLQIAGGSFENAQDAIEVSWPGEDKSSLFSFAGRAEEPVGTLLTLDHPRIRNLISDVPRFMEGDRVPAFQTDNLPGGVSGTWSLWQLRFPTEERTVQEFFPVFLNDDGKAFDRSANYLWDNLPNAELLLKNSLDVGQSLSIFNQHENYARSAGKPLYERMRHEYDAWLQERESNGRFHFETRFRLLNDIGLMEVRNFRKRQLEMEQADWSAHLENLKVVYPELTPLIIIRLIA